MDHILHQLESEVDPNDYNLCFINASANEAHFRTILHHLKFLKRKRYSRKLSQIQNGSRKYAETSISHTQREFSRALNHHRKSIAKKIHRSEKLIMNTSNPQLRKPWIRIMAQIGLHLSPPLASMWIIER